MILTETFERHTFRVQAVRVTSKNLDEIAEWCGGRVVRDGGGKLNIQVPLDIQRTRIDRAFIGYWVTRLEDSNSFRVYREQSFLGAFRKVMDEAEKFAEIHEKLLKLVLAQDSATYHQDSSGEMILLVEKTAHEICKMV